MNNVSKKRERDWRDLTKAFDQIIIRMMVYESVNPKINILSYY